MTTTNHEQVIAQITGAARLPISGETFDPAPLTTDQIVKALDWQAQQPGVAEAQKRGSRQAAHNYIRENGLEPLPYAPEKD